MTQDSSRKIISPLSPRKLSLTTIFFPSLANFKLYPSLFSTFWFLLTHTSGCYFHLGRSMTFEIGCFLIVQDSFTHCPILTGPQTNKRLQHTLFVVKPKVSQHFSKLPQRVKCLLPTQERTTRGNRSFLPPLWLTNGQLSQLVTGRSFSTNVGRNSSYLFD